MILLDTKMSWTEKQQFKIEHLPGGAFLRKLYDSCEFGATGDDDLVEDLTHRLEEVEKENQQLKDTVNHYAALTLEKLNGKPAGYYHVVLISREQPPSIKNLPAVRLHKPEPVAGSPLLARNLRDTGYTNLGEIVRIEETDKNDGPNIQGRLYAEVARDNEAADRFCEQYFRMNPQFACTEDFRENQVISTYQQQADHTFRALISRNGFDTARLLKLKDVLIRYVKGEDRAETVMDEFKTLHEDVPTAVLASLYRLVRSADDIVHGEEATEKGVLGMYRRETVPDMKSSEYKLSVG
jgi:hypothetical protein